MTIDADSSLWWLPLGRVPGLGAADLARALDGDDPPQLVDVRTALEWRAGHIRGAVHGSLLELVRRPPPTLDPGRSVVVICLTAHRSIPVVRQLLRHGFPRAAQLDGGMVAWRRARLPEVRGE